MHFISWKLINYWLSYAIFQKCLQILWNPLQIFSTELQNSLRYSAGQGLICDAKMLYFREQKMVLTLENFWKITQFGTI